MVRTNTYMAMDRERDSQQCFGVRYVNASDSLRSLDSWALWLIRASISFAAFVGSCGGKAWVATIDFEVSSAYPRTRRGSVREDGDADDPDSPREPGLGG